MTTNIYNVSLRPISYTELKVFICLGLIVSPNENITILILMNIGNWDEEFPSVYCHQNISGLIIVGKKQVLQDSLHWAIK